MILRSGFRSLRSFSLVRVSTDTQETRRQHDALDPICITVFEEKVSGTLSVDKRPGLLRALGYLRPDDLLTVLEVDRLGRNLLEGLFVLNELFERGVGVKVLTGIAAGEHTERSLILDLALALAEDRRRDISRKTRNGLEAARRRGTTGGRPTVVDPDKRAAILARHTTGQSIREIARGVGISVGAVHRIITENRNQPPHTRQAHDNTGPNDTPTSDHPQPGTHNTGADTNRTTRPTL
ncbi:recombinase family protein [Gordonia humi]|uniref:recombinase family protein n=1 Tax=Gordonia humi TaxID=686429 RepID=UPI003621F93D